MAKTKKEEVIKTDIKVGSKVFYPAHGAGWVKGSRKIEFGGEENEYLDFTFINDSISIATPVVNLGKLNIRTVLKEKELKELIKQLKTKKSKNPKAADYNELIDKIKDLDASGNVESFVEVIQFCEHVKKERTKEGRLIPTSITKYVKSSITYLIAELAVTSNKEFDQAAKTFEKLSGIEVDQ